MLSERIASLYAYGTYHTRMVYKIVPYAYGTYHTRMVCTIRVWYKIRVWYRTSPRLRMALFRYLRKYLQGKYLQRQLMFLISTECYRFIQPKTIVVALRSKKHPVARENEVIER